MLSQFKTVAELLADESRWTRGVLSRDKYDMPADVTNGNAVKFCVVGAVYKIYGEKTRESVEAVRQAASTLFKRRSLYDVARFNDYCTHQELLALVKEAGI